MKIKITAMISYETKLLPEYYADGEGITPIKTDDDVLEFERQEILNGDSALVAALWEGGALSDIKIEKLPEPAEVP